MDRTAGQRIKAKRLALGLKQIPLAKAAGITQGTLSAIEKGHTKALYGATLVGLTEGLGVSPEWIQTGIDRPAAVPDAEFRDLLGKLDLSDRWRYLALGYALLAEQQGKRPSVEDPYPGIPKLPRSRAKAPR